jgi:glutaminyl-peptide cyclotransferase
MSRATEFLSCLLLAGAIACSPPKSNDEQVASVKLDVPSFNADSAYHFVAQQVKFGPRVPNTKPHRDGAAFLVDRLKGYGAVVIEQDFQAVSFDRKQLKLKNVIASFFPEATKRILLAAHWDTRPFADKDEKDKNASFDGANDGASGVGVLLEIARVLSSSEAPRVGIDIILFDGEDWGEREGMSAVELPNGQESWWCLGSQYWANNKHKKGYSAQYGILLDMVGAKRSQFYREEVSLQFAAKTVEKVWDKAAQLGYSDYFVKQNVGGITDDHVFVNQLAKIPMIDIVPYKAGIGFFGDYHHTAKDNLDLISKETLAAVGNTLLHVLYYEE